MCTDPSQNLLSIRLEGFLEDRAITIQHVNRSPRTPPDLLLSEHTYIYCQYTCLTNKEYAGLAAIYSMTKRKTQKAVICVVSGRDIRGLRTQKIIKPSEPDITARAYSTFSSYVTYDPMPALVDCRGSTPGKLRFLLCHKAFHTFKVALQRFIWCARHREVS